MKLIDLTGEVFGKWTVLSRLPSRKNETMWLCRCQCGTENAVESGNLKSGRSVSCGCAKRGIPAKHGMTHTREFRIWSKMRDRCFNKNSADWADYGGRGITIAPEWQSFQIFYDDMGVAPDGYSIERIDVNGIYCKENCKWIPKAKQARNKTNTLRLTVNGETKPAVEWSEIVGIPVHCIKTRIRLLGWSHEKAVLTPHRNK